jgi:hypothetical protein
MIADALATYAKATARAFAGRENTVGASEVGMCARKIFFAKNADDHVYGAGSDEDYADPWGAALRGRLFEDHFGCRRCKRAMATSCCLPASVSELSSRAF